MKEVARRLKELLYLSIADVAVLSVDANIEIVLVDAQRSSPVEGPSVHLRELWLRTPYRTVLPATAAGSTEYAERGFMG